jgi:predicted thioesterase
LPCARRLRAGRSTASSTGPRRASASGTEITAEAVLERIEGKRLTFTVSANDAAGLVGAGRVTRVVVSVDSFMEKAR